MAKWISAIGLFFGASYPVFSQNSEILRLNINEDVTSSSNLSFYLIGLGVLLLGVISSEVFELNIFSRFFVRSRVSNLFLKAQVAFVGSSIDVYVRAMDNTSIDFVSTKEFLKRDMLNFKLLSLTGFDEFYTPVDFSEESYFNVNGEVIFCKKIDKKQSATFLTRVRIHLIADKVQKPFLKYLDKLSSST